MSIKRRWLQALFLTMLVGASAFGGVNPKDIEHTLYIMNETKVEFSLPDESDSGEGGPDECPPLVEMAEPRSEHSAPLRREDFGE